MATIDEIRAQIETHVEGLVTAVADLLGFHAEALTTVAQAPAETPAETPAPAEPEAAAEAPAAPEGERAFGSQDPAPPPVVGADAPAEPDTAGL